MWEFDFYDQLKTIFKVIHCYLFRSDDVRIQLITECPRTWPNWETCTKVNFTVPVYVAGNDYQLNRKSLEEMWNKYAKRSLEKINLQVRFKTVKTDREDQLKSFSKFLKINSHV
jgi:hypothetical protein